MEGREASAYHVPMTKPVDHTSSMVMSASRQAMLVAAVASNGDRDAFTRLFDYFAPRIHAYLLRIGADRGAAEEITQDTMAVLWSKAAQFDPTRSSLATWLYRIARNRRIDLVRRDRVVF